MATIPTELEVIWDGSITGRNRGYLGVEADEPRTLTLEDNRHLTEPRQDIPSLVIRIEGLLRQHAYSSRQLETMLKAKQASVAYALSHLRERGILATQRRPGTDGQRRAYICHYWIEEP